MRPARYFFVIQLSNSREVRGNWIYCIFFFEKLQLENGEVFTLFTIFRGNAGKKGAALYISFEIPYNPVFDS